MMLGMFVFSSEQVDVGKQCLMLLICLMLCYNPFGWLFHVEPCGNCIVYCLQCCYGRVFCYFASFFKCVVG